MGVEDFDAFYAIAAPKLVGQIYALVGSRQEAQDAKTRVVKARARLNFALDQMDEAERLAWDALQASARAETHGQLAEDPLFQNAPASAPSGEPEK